LTKKEPGGCLTGNFSYSGGGLEPFAHAATGMTGGFMLVEAAKRGTDHGASAEKQESFANL
jgi:hypothetical protein